ncbi:MAG: CpaF family protein [Acidimicrobiales bacterium]
MIDTPTDHGLTDRVWRAFASEAENPGLPIDVRIGSLIDASAPLATRTERSAAVHAVRARIDGLGVLQPFADDTTVSEIIVNAGHEVWIERAGELVRVAADLDPVSTEQLVRRLAASVGRRIDRAHPTVDARLADGSRLHAILPPLAIDGPCLSIRRFVEQGRDLSHFGPPDLVGLLAGLVSSRATLVVAGSTSSGKTSLLNAVASNIDPKERIVTIEDAAELALPLPHVVRLETRAATETLPAVDVRELVRNALRMRPDRLLCGEMRGGEAIDLVQAMNTGHAGSMTTVHANSPVDALHRIETMMLAAGLELPLAAARAQLASCIDVVVMVERRAEGERGVVELATPHLAADSSIGKWTCRPLWSSDRRSNHSLASDAA